MATISIKNPPKSLPFVQSVVHNSSTIIFYDSTKILSLKAMWNHSIMWNQSIPLRPKKLNCINFESMKLKVASHMMMIKMMLTLPIFKCLFDTILFYFLT